MPSVAGVLETSLYVDDLRRATEFYKALFGFEVYISDQRISILLVPDRQVLLLFKKGGSVQPAETPGGTIPPTDGDGNLHLAFAITSEEYGSWENRLSELGISIESRVTWPGGGRSLYFRDPDRHVIELATPGTWPNY